jgi:cytochrome P450
VSSVRPAVPAAAGRPDRVEVDEELPGRPGVAPTATPAFDEGGRRPTPEPDVTASHEPAETSRGPVPEASVVDSVRGAAGVLLPLLSRGLIVRRPPVVAVAEKLDLDRRAVRELQRLRGRYGPGPVRVKLPAKDVALVLDPDDVHRILGGSPDPFAADTPEKKAALGHFQPSGVLASAPEDRPDRRRFNEQALDTGNPVHRLAPALTAAMREETDELATEALRAGQLTWDAFVTSWWRVVRRVVFGAGARNDHALTDQLGALRARANWAYLARDDEDLRARFHQRIDEHLRRAEPGSLAGLVAQLPADAHTRVEEQVPQWLFAYDPGGIAAWRALALLAVHRAHRTTAFDEVDSARGAATPPTYPHLRAAVLDGLRLWPTTPGVLRQTTEETSWTTGILPAGTSLVIFAPFFHRDDTRLPYADRFAPELWIDEAGTGRAGPAHDGWPLIPFSAGPVVCPGRELVLLTTSTVMAGLLERIDLQLQPSGRLRPDAPMPSVLDPFRLRFTVRERS